MNSTTEWAFNRIVVSNEKLLVLNGRFGRGVCSEAESEMCVFH